MTLEHQKFDLIQWITGLEDEALVRRITELKQETIPNEKNISQRVNGADSSLDHISGVTSLAELKAQKFNLDEVVRKQKARKLIAGELEELIDAVDVQESIEELLTEVG